MKQHTHVVRGCLHNLSDLLITEIVLEFELNNFLLPRRQCSNDPQQESGRFLLFELVKRHRLLAVSRFNQFLVEIHDSPVLSTNVERSISANRK